MFLLNTGLFATNIGYCFTLFCWARDTVAENTPALNGRLLSAFNGATPYHVCQGIFETLNVRSLSVLTALLNTSSSLLLVMASSFGVPLCSGQIVASFKVVCVAYFWEI